MAVNYARLFHRRATPQSQPIPGSTQVPNSAGGYAWRVDDWTRLDRLLILDPASAADTRARGVIYTRLECYGQAKDDFERYLQLAPDADDAGAIREQLVELAKQVVLIH